MPGSTASHRKELEQDDETWHLVRKATESGVLRESTRGAKCSGLFYNPCCHGPGPKTSEVICVYTMEEDVDRAGFILINMLKLDLKYKTDEATLDGDYSWKVESFYHACLYGGPESSFPKSTFAGLPEKRVFVTAIASGRARDPCINHF